VRPDLSQDLPRVIMLVSDAADLGDEPTKSRIVDDVLILSRFDHGSHRNLLLGSPSDAGVMTQPTPN
jgi:hypothetical protein